MKNYNSNQKSIASIQLRITQALVKNNGIRSIWNADAKAKLYFMTIIIEDINGTFNGSLCLDSFSGIGSNDYIDTYRPLYQWTGNVDLTSPKRFFFISTVIRCKGRISDISKSFYNLKNDVQYLEQVQILSSIVSDSATFPLIVDLAVKLSNIIKRYLGKIDYTQLATVNHYFNRNFGDFDKVGKFNLKKSTKNVDFYYELIVHDKKMPEGVDDAGYYHNLSGTNRNSSFQSIKIN